MVEISGDSKFAPGKSHAHVSMELVLRVHPTVYTSIVRGQALKGSQKATHLVDYQITVLESEDQVARLLATEAGPEVIEAKVLLKFF